MEKFLIDDSFYAYSIARNIAFGDGVVFNDGIPTNGFHPLYVFVLVPIFELTYSFGINVPVYASLVLLSLCSVLTGVFVYLIGTEAVGERTGLLGAFLWLANPMVIFDSLLGLETPIQVLLLSILAWYILRIDDRSHITYREGAVVGTLSGLAILARLDSVFVIGSLYLIISVRHLRKDTERRNVVGSLRTLRTVLVSGTVTAVLLLPWFAWSVLAVGRLTPVSGDAVRRLRRPHTLGESFEAFDQLLSLISQTTPLALTPGAIRSVIGTDLLLLGGSLTAFLVIAVLRGDRLRSFASGIDFLLVGSVPYYAFYVFYLQGFRAWYTPFTHFVFTLVFAFAVVSLIELVADADSIRIPKLRTVAYMFVVTIYLVAFLASGVSVYDKGVAPQERTKWKTATYLEDQLPPDARVGAFNTGVFQYYTPTHEVLNLDGVTNPHAHRAMSRGEINQYVRSEEIEYIVDPAVVLKTHLVNLDCDVYAIETFRDKYSYSSVFSDRVWSFYVKLGIYRICSARNDSARLGRVSR